MKNKKKIITSVIYSAGQYFSFDPDLFKAQFRIKEVSNARKFLCKYLYEMNYRYTGVDFSKSFIGKSIQRDHSTVIYCIESLNNEISFNKEVKKSYNDFQNYIDQWITMNNIEIKFADQDKKSKDISILEDMLISKIKKRKKAQLLEKNLREYLINLNITLKKSNYRNYGDYEESLKQRIKNANSRKAKINKLITRLEIEKNDIMKLIKINQ